MIDNVNSPRDIITYTYIFAFKNGVVRTFAANLDKEKLYLVTKPRSSLPEWAKLEFKKCPNCLLDEEKNPYCPVAANITDLIEFFSDAASYEEADVTIETPNRSYFRHTSLQKGISSLLGIYMTTSGCPILEKLKPMVKYHLPFATVEETTYRAMSMYLLSQYFVFRRNKEPDWELRNLTQIYSRIQVVNTTFAERLKEAISRDSSINALVILDTFATYILYELDETMFEKLEKQFSALSYVM